MLDVIILGTPIALLRSRDAKKSFAFVGYYPTSSIACLFNACMPINGNGTLRIVSDGSWHVAPSKRIGNIIEVTNTCHQEYCGYY